MKIKRIIFLLATMGNLFLNFSCSTTNEKVDFILISPSPIVVSQYEQITLRAYGFRFRTEGDMPPSPSLDPLEPETKKMLQEKYISLGPVEVEWKIPPPPPPPAPKTGPFTREDYFRAKREARNQAPKPIYSLKYTILPDGKDPSKAVLLRLLELGIRKGGVMAILKGYPYIWDQNDLEITDSGYSFLYKNQWQKKPWIQTRKVEFKTKKLRQDCKIRTYYECKDKIYGWLIYYGKATWSPGAEFMPYIHTNRKTVQSYTVLEWDKKHLEKAFDLKDHQPFLDSLKTRIWKKKYPFSFYEYHLALYRYWSLEEKGSIDINSLNQRMAKEIIGYETKEHPDIERFKKYYKTSPEWRFEKSPNRMQNILKSIRNRDGESSTALRIVEIDKEVRNALASEVRRIFDEYKKKNKKNEYYYDLFRTICLIGMATPLEEEELEKYFKKNGWDLPRDWNNRHSRWK